MTHDVTRNQAGQCTHIQTEREILKSRKRIVGYIEYNTNMMLSEKKIPY